LRKQIDKATIIKSGIVPVYESEEENLLSLVESMERYLKSEVQVSDPMGMEFLLNYLEKIIVSPAFKKPKNSGTEKHKIKNGTINTTFDYEKDRLMIIKMTIDMDYKNDADEIINFVNLCKNVSEKPENTPKIKEILR